MTTALLIWLAVQPSGLPVFTELPRDRATFERQRAERDAGPGLFVDRYPELTENYARMQARLKRGADSAEQPPTPASIDALYAEFFVDDGNPDLNEAGIEFLVAAWHTLSAMNAARMSAECRTRFRERTLSLIDGGVTRHSPTVVAMLGESLARADGSNATARERSDALLADAFDWAVELGSEYEQKNVFAACTRQWGEAFRFEITEAMLGVSLPERLPADYARAVRKLQELVDRLPEIERDSRWAGDCTEAFGLCRRVDPEPAGLREDAVAKFLTVSEIALHAVALQRDHPAVEAIDRALGKLLREVELDHAYTARLFGRCIDALGSKRASRGLIEIMERIAADPESDVMNRDAARKAVERLVVKAPAAKSDDAATSKP